MAETTGRSRVCEYFTTLFLTLTVIGTVQGLQCPSCTYITTNADMSAPVRTVIDRILNVFQDPECAKVLNGPIPEIKEETCSAAGGKVSRCSYYKGSLTVELNLLLTTATIPLQVYQRGCFYSLPANVPSNGCYDRKDISEDKTFLKQTLDQASSLFTSLDAVKFEGNRCLCSDTYCQDINGVSQGAVLSPVTLLLVIVAALLVR